ncbi:MAG: glycosyltransferase [Anaerolineae bacterium]|nr:glycosyltransferase [Anaerolineae bacterium]
MNDSFQPNLISVMMPAYNAEKFIGEAIDSVLAQTYPQWELIVVNDGSKDDTAVVAAQYNDPRIKLIHQPNGGEAAARNTALQNLGGEFLAFLDADDQFLPDHLEKTVAVLQANPTLHGVYTDGIYIDTAGQGMEPLSSQRRGPFTGWIFPEIVRASDVFGPPTCTLLRSSLIFERELQFDTRIVIGPDWDFLTRYCEWAQFGNLPDRTVLYRIHQTNITVQVDRQRRAGYLALCREKAIHLERFAACPLDVQTAVFYDLLVNLLAGQAERQTAVTQWPQFQTLPLAEQARLYRLMAGKSLMNRETGPHVAAWLQQAYRLNPADRRNKLMLTLYRLHPTLCRAFLHTRQRGQAKTKASPFANLNQS